MSATSPQVLLALKNLTLGYSALPAVHHLTAELKQGENLAVIGPNGGGKTTLLKGILGELKPLGGKILWPNGKVKLGYLPQQAMLNLDIPISVLDFLSLGLWQEIGSFKKVTAPNKQKIVTALAAVKLAGLENRLVTSLSGGQKQRVIFARLLVEDADLLLLDEPFAAVDQATTEELLKLMLQLNLAGKTLITIIHNLDQVKAYFPQCLFLAREVLGFGATEEVLTPENLAKARSMQIQLDPLAPWCELD